MVERQEVEPSATIELGLSDEQSGSGELVEFSTLTLGEPPPRCHIVVQEMDAIVGLVFREESVHPRFYFGRLRLTLSAPELPNQRFLLRGLSASPAAGYLS
jgi:hypothetical protein